MITWVQAHGVSGILAGVALGAAIFNIVMSALAQIFTALGKQEPVWMQTLGAYGLKVTQWLSANTPTPTAPAASASVQNKSS